MSSSVMIVAQRASLTTRALWADPVMGSWRHRRPGCRDGAHDPSLDAPETTSARLSKHLSHDTRSAGRHDFQAESIERAVADIFRRYGEADRRAVNNEF